MHERAALDRRGPAFLEGVSTPRVFASIAWAIAGLGILLRVLRFAYGRDLWLDEVYITTNIESRSFGRLMEPLDIQQGAGLLWLWMTKLCEVLFGGGERALRLPSLLAGIGAMLCFGPLARRLLPPVIALLSLVAAST